MPEQVFANIVVMSAAGGLLALFWLMIKPVTEKVFSPSWQYYVWLTVLIVMLLPVRINIPAQTVPQPDFVSERTADTQNTDYEPAQTATYAVRDVTEYIRDIIVPRSISRFDSVYFLTLIWLLGVLTAFLTKFIKYLIFLRAILKNSVSCAEHADIPKRLAVYKTDMLDAPLIAGLLRPKLFLPSAEVPRGDMSLILMHELTHYRRNDILYKWLSMAVQCLHWFNPMAYVVSRQIDLACEISCDYAVTRKLTEYGQREYMNMILRLLANSNARLRPLTTQMASGKKILKRRFAMIGKKIRINRKIAVLSVVLAAAVFATTVFASGILNGKLIKPFENSAAELNTDEPVNNGFNFLLVGVDKDSRADTVMLAAIRENRVDVLSIPRNTLLNGRRLSDVYLDENGGQKLIDAVRQEFSVPVHYYAEMNLTAVQKIVDELGGIEFDVPMDMSYDDPYQDLHIDLKKGVQTLDGKSACALLQYRRGYTEGDLARIQIGQRFVKEAVSQKLTAENLGKLPQICKIVSDSLITNYPLSNPKQLVDTVSSFGGSEISFETIPGKNEVYNGVFVYETDKTAAEGITKSFADGL